MSSVYLHIPFCRTKCPYCDFYSQPGSAAQLAEYLQLVEQQLEFLRQDFPDQPPLQTVFFGGGTPSLLAAEQVARLLDRLTDAFGLAQDCEISLEANPGTLDAHKLSGYRQAGINRLSIGVQSLSEQRLQILGRSHSREEALAAVALARAAGFVNLGLDLMFALPDQSKDDLQAELDELLGLEPEHISVYGLSYEAGTEFTRRQVTGELQEADERLYAEHYRLLHLHLTQAGFEHYEISNFARPGRRCRHNQVYWQRRACLALGCGAHGFAEQGWGERYLVPADLTAYRARLAAHQDPREPLERFDRQGAMSETLYLALRTADGLAREPFRQRFGLYPEEAYPRQFEQLQGYLQRVADSWRFDLAGWLIYDHLISEFL